MAEFARFVAVEGLAELRRDLRRIDPALLVGVRTSLRDAAGIVADEGERRASERSGAMARSIRPRVRGNYAEVRATAKRRSARYPSGYPYPKRIEFEGGGGREGPRAFLRPALEAKSREVEERLGRMLDDIADTHWRG